MSNNTKDRIIEAALEMYADKGYAGTNTRELAASLGLTKSSLYRHFDSKYDIWKSVYLAILEEYNQHFDSPEQIFQAPESTEELYDLSLKMVDFTIHDKKIIMMRKILYTEQFRDERIRKLATKHFNTDIPEIFRKVFDKMMDQGVLRKDDPKMLGLMYASTISSLIHLCDREPQREEEVMENIKEFIRYFINQYGTENNDK